MYNKVKLTLIFGVIVSFMINYSFAFSRLFVITNNSKTSTISIQRIRPVTIGHDQYGNFWCPGPNGIKNPANTILQPGQSIQCQFTTTSSEINQSFEIQNYTNTDNAEFGAYCSTAGSSIPTAGACEVAYSGYHFSLYGGHSTNYIESKTDNGLNQIIYSDPDPKNVCLSPAAAQELIVKASQNPVCANSPEGIVSESDALGRQWNVWCYAVSVTPIKSLYEVMLNPHTSVVCGYQGSVPLTDAEPWMEYNNSGLVLPSSIQNWKINYQCLANGDPNLCPWAYSN